jgi:DUF4097 and DUF4098 domain-containing protein YvlB
MAQAQAMAQAGQAFAQAETKGDAKARAREAAQRQRESLERLRQTLQRQRGRRDLRFGPEFTEAFSKTVRVGSNGTFELSNLAGDVAITGGGGDDVRIQATKRVHARTESDAQNAFRDIDIQVIERSGMVQVKTENSLQRNDSAAAVDYTIALPSGATVSVKTLSGNLRVSNVKGELRTESVNGDVTIASAARLRTLKAISGHVELTDVQGSDVVASVVSGDVNVRNLKARSLDLQSVSGDLRFSDAQCDRVTLRTVNGDIDYAGPLARTGRYDLQSHSGDVRLTPIGTAAFDIDASTFNGDVRSDFPLSTGAPADVPARQRFNRSVHGTVGKGGAIVSVRTFTGDVIIVKR